MAKDGRLYAKFTLDFPDSHKILPLSDGAFRALVEMTIYSRRMLTDGFVSERLAHAKWSLDACQELLANDPDNPSLRRADGGYLIHDFSEHQSTKAEIEADRARKRDAGRKGGIAKAAGKSAAPSKTVAPAKQEVSTTPSKIYPETEAQTQTETNKRSITPAARGSRLTTDWAPDVIVNEKLSEQFPDYDLTAILETFRDYWVAKSGRDATKLDWNATWRNWVRNQRNPPKRDSGGPSVGW